MPKYTCKVCGKTANSDYCFIHKPRKKIPVSMSKDVLIFKEKPLMHDFFMSIWKKRPHRSEISNVYLGKEALSIFFHHILPKNKYPEAMLDEENIILLTLDEHTNVENNIYRYEEINNRRTYLKTKYNIL
jgi:hypothetical protein